MDKQDIVNMLIESNKHLQSQNIITYPNSPIYPNYPVYSGQAPIVEYTTNQ